MMVSRNCLQKKSFSDNFLISVKKKIVHNESVKSSNQCRDSDNANLNKLLMVPESTNSSGITEKGNDSYNVLKSSDVCGTHNGKSSKNDETLLEKTCTTDNLRPVPVSESDSGSFSNTTPTSVSLIHNTEENKQGRKRVLEFITQPRESRSQSPSECSVSSQGSVDHPRQKKRFQQVDSSNSSYHRRSHSTSDFCGLSQPNNAVHKPNSGSPWKYFHGNERYRRSFGSVKETSNDYCGGQSSVPQGNSHFVYQNNFFNIRNNNYSNNRYVNKNQSIYNGVSESGFPFEKRFKGNNINDPAGYFSFSQNQDEPAVGAKFHNEIKGVPRQLLQNSKWAALSKQIWEVFQKRQQKDSTFHKKVALRDRIFCVIRNVFPKSQLFIVGSSLNGFGANNSDVDMCLMVTPNELDQRTEATTFLKILERELNNCETALYELDSNLQQL